MQNWKKRVEIMFWASLIGQKNRSINTIVSDKSKIVGISLLLNFCINQTIVSQTTSKKRSFTMCWLIKTFFNMIFIWGRSVVYWTSQSKYIYYRNYQFIKITDICWIIWAKNMNNTFVRFISILYKWKNT